MPRALQLAISTKRYALTRLSLGTTDPDWVRGDFAAVVRSREGITVVCEEAFVPEGVETCHGYRCIEITGSFEITSVGVLAAVVQPLAEGGISLFAYSTWETDYIFVQQSNLERGLALLSAAGHAISRQNSG